MTRPYHLKRHGFGQVCGETHPAAKLTESDVLALRRYFKNHPRANVTRWAARCGVAESTLSMALSGDRWAHLPGAIRKRVGRKNQYV